MGSHDMTVSHSSWAWGCEGLWEPEEAEHTGESMERQCLNLISETEWGWGCAETWARER